MIENKPSPQIPTKQYFLSDALATFKLNKDRIVVGSVASADVRLIGIGVSPIHAVIEIGPEIVISDLASDSGVTVNGIKIVSQKLRSGDELMFGTRKLRFVIEEEFAAVAAEDMSVLLLEDSRAVEEIFDWRPTSQPALEVVMSWEGTILDVEHFIHEREVTVGESRRNDFGVPFFLGTPRFQLIGRQGTDFVLNVSEGMKGVIRRTGRVQRLEEQKKGPVLLQAGDFAKVSVGAIDFYVSFTAAPPKLKRKRVFARDPFFVKVMLVSLAFTAAMLAALLSITVHPSVEADQVSDRVATILYQPEMYAYKTATRLAMENALNNPPETPVKNPLDNQVDPKSRANQTQTGKNNAKNTNAKNQQEKSLGQREAREGRGAKALGKSGTRGTINGRKHPDKQNIAMRPSPEGGKGLGGGHSKAGDDGNVDMLKGVTGKIQDLLSSSSQRLGKGGEKLQGFGGFNTQGGNGLALSGDGKGGGGNAASLGGLSDRGKGGGRIGVGKGAAGSGNGIVGAHARPVIRSGGPEEAIVMGAIDRDAVEAALLAHRDEFRNCYEREINADNPRLSGTVIPSFVIGASGRVTEAGIESSSLKNIEAEKCVLRVIRRIDFPLPRGGGVVQVSYPFKFSAGNR